jgi:hypothetical protein
MNSRKNNNSKKQCKCVNNCIFEKTLHTYS